jgi:serine/threonine-protein kinase
MKAQRLQKVDGVFQAALELAPEHRAQFLDEACADDSDLRRDVESLIDAHEQAGDLIEDSASDIAAELLAKNQSVAKPGRIIGQYTVEDQLGAGGMGEVFLARDKMGRKVALKLLARQLNSDESSIARFQHEARTLLALNHPNIVTVYDIGEVDSVYYIASELVEGQTLRQHLDKGDIELREVLDIAIQIATGLAAAHEKGVVHRDIKPENIMIRRDGYVKVLDFGIAKLIEGPAVTNPEALTIRQVHTAEGTVIGTAPYMSPEQARGLPVDARTDTWSLGVVLYEAMSGRRPFLGETIQDVIASVLQKEPPPLARYVREVPEPLEWIISRSLRKDKDARYQTASGLLADLREFRKRVEFAAEIERTGTPNKQFGADTQSTRTETRNSIAVLPFANMSVDAENEYFCDGLAEELLNALAKIEDLKVAARSSAFSFKGKNARVSEIGRALGVQTVLEGSVRKSDNRLRITVQLISAADGYHLWSERYDREIQDIFDVQDEITLAVVDALKVRLLGDEKAAVLRRLTDNPEAYELYLKGRYFWFKFNPEGWTRAREFFEQALQKDPNFALAYAGLADALTASAVFTPPKEVFPKAKEMVQEAIKLDSSMAEAWCSKAAVRFFYEWDWAGAESDCKQSINLNPQFVLVHDLYSLCLLALGRFEEAIAEARRACELDPLSAYFNASLGFTLFFSRRYDEATDQLLMGAELDPGNIWAHMWLVDLYEQQGMHPQALHHRQKLLTLTGNNELAAEIGQEFERSGYRGVLLKSLDGLHKRSKLSYVPALEFATIHVRLGEQEKALDWLEKGFDERTMYLSLLKVRPAWDTLHSNPRYVELLRRMGLDTDGESRDKSTAPREKMSER